MGTSDQCDEKIMRMQKNSGAQKSSNGLRLL